jgi:hypothetical protein
LSNQIVISGGRQTPDHESSQQSQRVATLINHRERFVSAKLPVA